MKDHYRQIGVLILCVAVCFGAAAIGSLFTYPNVNGWYANLRKPSWTPPNWLFGPVWSILYLLMALAAWEVWRIAGLRSARRPLVWFSVQLILNVTWSALFFAIRSPGLALVEILFLWFAILITLVSFYRQSVLAGALLAPYLAWVSFAVALNWAIWWKM
jgi:benzodiazapine receptor